MLLDVDVASLILKLIESEEKLCVVSFTFWNVLLSFSIQTNVCVSVNMFYY